MRVGNSMIMVSSIAALVNCVWVTTCVTLDGVVTVRDAAD